MMVAVYHITYYIAAPPTALIVIVTTTTVPLPVANPALNHAYLLYILVTSYFFVKVCK